MLNAQEIREKMFEKAVFGGYDMGGVDAFMEEAASTVAALQKENNVLKTKMKVLVDKIEEYRLDEDAMRNALLSAQKVSAQIESDARTRAEAIQAKARAEADKALSGITDRTAAEQAKLAEAQRRSVRFIADMRKLCQKQLAFLDNVSSVMPPVSETNAAPAEDDALQSIENSARRAVSEPAPHLNISAEAPAEAAADDDGTRVFHFGA